jgi:HJR/Mrr/RecB family endonuclease
MTFIAHDIATIQAYLVQVIKLKVSFKKYIVSVRLIDNSTHRIILFLLAHTDIDTEMWTLENVVSYTVLTEETIIA